MFDVLCSGCHRRQLLTARRIRGFSRLGGDVVVAYECWCGTEGVWQPGTGQAASAGQARG